MAVAQIPDQARCISEGAPPLIRTIRRSIPWRLGTPLFVEADPLRPARLVDFTARANRVFVVGEPATGTAVAAENRDADSLYLNGHFPLVRKAKGQVTYAAQWFGDGYYSAETAAETWRWLATEIRNVWRDDCACLLMTPASTGRDLFARSIGNHEGYPVMSADAQRAVRATAGQGRMEVFPAPPRGPTIRKLFEYDARMAYVALLDSLPVGDPEELDGHGAQMWAEARPYSEARYHVTWIAPDGWSYPGLLPAHVEGSERAWSWPLEGEGWCGGAELFLARAQGWRIGYRGAMAWPHQASPLRTWRGRLQRVLACSAVDDQLDETQRRMVRNAVRATLLHTIGAFHGAPHKRTVLGELDDLGEEATKVRALGDGRYTWQEDREAAWPEMAHPEWSATVWGRARARLASSHRGTAGFLTVPWSSIVAVRTDAIYTTSATGWEAADNGDPGRYTLRHTWDYGKLGVEWPTSGPDLLRLRSAA